MPARKRRLKISTTIAPENRAFLKSLVKRGKAANFAEAFDNLLDEARRAENRERLDRATAEFYASLSGDALKEERELELAVGSAASRVDYDAE
jgi:hypothetical protein